ncbi:MAG: hypothetical protein MK106_08720 [Mariniblastus sp.]|nr:hypothetical protein [Mariniblastus sp.]
MSTISKLNYFKLAFLSKPKCDRLVYKKIAKNRYQSIVEVGIQNLARTQNILRIAETFGLSGQIKYTGIDLFDGRPDSQPSLPLKMVHQSLKPLGAKIQLAPGDALQALNRIANSHLRTDLIIVSPDTDLEAMEQAWFYVPRMLHANSTVLIRSPKDPLGPFQTVGRLEIERKADFESSQRRIVQAA